MQALRLHRKTTPTKGHLTMHTIELTECQRKMLEEIITFEVAKYGEMYNPSDLRTLAVIEGKLKREKR